MPKKYPIYPYKIVKDKSFTPIERIKITGTEQAANYCKQFYGEDIDIYESVFMLMLNRGNYTTAWVKISQGGINSSVIDVTMIGKYAIESLSKGIILCHNHPSGELRPSDADIKITNRVKQALNLFDINLLDHIIITSNGCYSFAEEGLL